MSFNDCRSEAMLRGDTGHGPRGPLGEAAQQQSSSWMWSSRSAVISAAECNENGYSHSCQMLLSTRQNMLAMCVRAWEKVGKGNKMTLCWEKGCGWGPCAVDRRTLAVPAVFIP